MSPDDDKKLRPQYDRMTTQELEQLLRQDLDAPGPGLPPEDILEVSQLLLGREEGAGSSLSPQHSWQEFRARQPRKGRRRIHRTMLIAAVLAGALSFSLMAGAMGGKELRTVVGAWDTYGFYFDNTGPYDPAAPLTMGDVDDPQWRQLLREDRSPGLTPMWFPERFQLTDRIVEDEAGEQRYHAWYTAGEERLYVTVLNFKDNARRRLSVSGDPLEVSCHDDVIYYLFASNEWYVAAWFEDGYECSVSGKLTLEEARQIIRSVQEGKQGR